MGHTPSRGQDAEEGRPLVPSKSPGQAKTDGGQAKQALPPSGEILLPAICYIFTSSALILLNKHALSSFGFTCPNTMLFFHCALAVGLVKGAEATGNVQLEPLRWKVVTIWFPVNLLFVGARLHGFAWARMGLHGPPIHHHPCPIPTHLPGMIATSYLALPRIGIGMFTLLKVCVWGGRDLI
jgi:hypothetical protein